MTLEQLFRRMLAGAIAVSVLACLGYYGFIYAAALAGVNV